MPQGGPVLLLLTIGCGASLADLDRACSAGDAATCDALVDLYSAGKAAGPAAALKDRPAPDPAKATAYAILGCTAGNASCCDHAGWAYQYGEGIPADRSQAVASYRKGCLQGSGAACSKGALLLHEDNDPGARPLFERGCNDAGDGGSCYLLASLHPGSDTENLSLYQRACELDPVDGSGCWAAGLYLLKAGERAPALVHLDRGCARMGGAGAPCLEATRVRQGPTSGEPCASLPLERVCWTW